MGAKHRKQFRENFTGDRTRIMNHIVSAVLLLIPVVLMSFFAGLTIYHQSGADGLDHDDVSVAAETAGEDGASKYVNRRAGDFTYDKLSSGRVCPLPSGVTVADLDACTDSSDSTTCGAPARGLLREYSMLDQYLYARYGLGPMGAGAAILGAFIFMWHCITKACVKGGKGDDNTSLKDNLMEQLQFLLELLWFALMAALLHNLDLSSHDEEDSPGLSNQWKDLSLGVRRALIDSNCISQNCADAGSVTVAQGGCREYKDVMPGALGLVASSFAFYLLYVLVSYDRLNAIFPKIYGRVQKYRAVNRQAVALGSDPQVSNI